MRRFLSQMRPVTRGPCGHGGRSLGSSRLGLRKPEVGVSSHNLGAHTSDTAVWLQLMLGLGSQEETRFHLSQEDPLSEGMATSPACLPRASHGTEERTASQRVGRA